MVLKISRTRVARCDYGRHDGQVGNRGDGGAKGAAASLAVQNSVLAAHQWNQLA